ncbi:MAG: hypothetical protein ACOYMV_10155 [Verrucomicrobiia bacterium]
MKTNTIGRRMARVLATMATVGALTGAAVAGEVRLADKGQAQCVIVVPPGSMVWEGSDKPESGAVLERALGERRRLQRDSVKDLALSIDRART